MCQYYQPCTNSKFKIVYFSQDFYKLNIEIMNYGFNKSFRILFYGT